MPDSLKFSLATSMRGAQWVKEFKEATTGEAITTSERDRRYQGFFPVDHFTYVERLAPSRNLAVSIDRGRARPANVLDGCTQTGDMDGPKSHLATSISKFMISGARFSRRSR